MKIVLVDSQRLFREGLKEIIQKMKIGEVVGEAGTGQECKELLALLEEIPDLLISEVLLPDMEGKKLFPELMNAYPSMKVCIVSGNETPEVIIGAREMHINGYLSKNANVDELVKALSVISSGREYIQPELLPKVNAALIRKNGDYEKMKQLTKREIEVLKLIAEGQSNREIGSFLKISERTVKNHISSIFQKIDVADRTQAAVFAIKNDIVAI